MGGEPINLTIENPIFTLCKW